jgi:hypothetical protein
MKYLNFLVVAVSLTLNSCTNVTVQTPQAPQAAQAPETTSNTSNSTVTKVSPKTVSPPVDNAPQLTSQPAASCNYSAGKAVGGEAINVDLCSIQVKSPESIAFVYYLNNEQVKSEANCSNATWTTFPERQVNRPQSSATQNMLDTVCRRQTSTSGATSKAGAAIVFDPPSNVRVSPNGAILCAVQKKTTINIYGSNGAWYKTDVCGSLGFIHGDQLKF